MFFDAAALCWKSSGHCEDFKFMCPEEQEGAMANGYQTHISTKNLTEEFKYVAFILKEYLVDVGKH